MRRIFFLAPFLCAGLTSCDASGEEVLREAYADALTGRHPAEASIISDRFVVIPELGVVFPRPQGEEWKVTKKLKSSKAGPIADVDIENTAKGGSFSVIVAKGDPDTLKNHARLLGEVLGRFCGRQPSIQGEGGLDGYTFWLSCAASRKKGEETVYIFMRAAVTVRRRIPGRIISTIGVWSPDRDKEMNAAMTAVIEKVQPLLDASIGHP